MFKDKKNILIVALLAATTALILFAVKQQKQIKALSGGLPSGSQDKKPETITDETADRSIEKPTDAKSDKINGAEPERKYHQSPLLFVLTAAEDGVAYTTPTFSDEGETFKKGEILGLVHAMDWEQMKNTQPEFPIRFMYSKEYEGKKIQIGKTKQIDPRAVKVNIKHMPMRYVPKKNLSLNGTFYHPVTIS